MTNQTLPSPNERLSLKEATGWFAAGAAFRKALASLSDGAFRLFAFLCLEADRRTGRFRTTHKELAVALGKSKRVIGVYVAELEAEGICLVKPGKNQFAGTIFEISDDYWPYRRAASTLELPEQQAYVDAVRECFLALGCGSGKFDARVVKILSRDTEAVRIGSCMADATSLAATAVDSRLVVTRRSGIGDFCYARIRERSSMSARFQRDA